MYTLRDILYLVLTWTTEMELQQNRSDLIHKNSFRGTCCSNSNPAAILSLPYVPRSSACCTSCDMYCGNDTLQRRASLCGLHGCVICSFNRTIVLATADNDQNFWRSWIGKDNVAAIGVGAWFDAHDWVQKRKLIDPLMIFCWMSKLPLRWDGKCKFGVRCSWILSREELGAYCNKGFWGQLAPWLCKRSLCCYGIRLFTRSGPDIRSGTWS